MGALHRLLSKRDRHGHYAPANNDVPGPVGGTFRLVYERGSYSQPDPGAMAFGYSTFQFLKVPLMGPGLFLTRGTPDPRSGGAVDVRPFYAYPAVTPDASGLFNRFALLPPMQQDENTGPDVSGAM